MSRNPERRGRVQSSRLPGIDLARFLAIVGMIAVHTLQVTVPNPVLDLSNGNASTLFAVLAGVGAALASRGALQAGATATARLALVARGAGLVALGLLLGLMPSPAVVILVYLGVTFVVMAAFIRARSWVLMVAAGVLAVGGPAVNVAVRTSLGLVNETGSAGIDQLVADPLAYARGIFLTGTYPVTTWIVYALIGILLGRGILAAIQAGTLHRFAVRSLIVGAAAAMSAHMLSTAAYFAFARNDLLSDLLSRVDPEQLAPMKDRIDEFLLGTGYGAPTGWAALALDVPHTGTVLDIARGVGVATAIIGACLLLPLRTPAPILLRPVLAAGSAPLTSYAAHLLLLALTSGAWMIQGLPLPLFTGWTAFFANVGLLLALGAALALVGRRGPLETLLGRLAAIPADWARRSRSSHPTNSRGGA